MPLCPHSHHIDAEEMLPHLKMICDLATLLSSVLEVHIWLNSLMEKLCQFGVGVEGRFVCFIQHDVLVVFVYCD